MRRGESALAVWEKGLEIQGLGRGEGGIIDLRLRDGRGRDCRSKVWGDGGIADLNSDGRRDCSFKVWDCSFKVWGRRDWRFKIWRGEEEGLQIQGLGRG